MSATSIGTYATPALLKQLIGTTDDDDNVLVGLICDRVNQHIESETKQPICPVASTTYLYDVFALGNPVATGYPYSVTREFSGNVPGMSRLFAPMPVSAATKGIGGLRAITLLEVAPYSGGTYATIPSTEYFLRERMGPIGPYKWVVLSDRGTSYTKFPIGRATVRITATAGWDAIPDDLIRVALAIAQRDWNLRSVGGQGVDEQGQTIVPALHVTNQERDVLWGYKLKVPY